MSEQQIYWETEALRACGLIFGSADRNGGGLDDLEKTLDFAITEFWGNYSPEIQPEVVKCWKRIGSNAISLNWSRASSGISQIFTPGSMLEVLVKKQRDYGHNNIKRFGREGLLMRCHDKVARFRNLYGGDFEPSNETIDDTILDILGYSTIGIMWEENTFLLPLRDREEKILDWC